MEPKKARYVINRETNAIYPFKQRYLERPEFAPFYDDPPPVDRATGQCVLRDKPDPLMSVETEKKKQNETVEEDAKHKALVECMLGMQKMAFATASGKPNLNVLERAVSFPVDKPMRDKAFAEYRAIKEASK